MNCNKVLRPCEAMCANLFSECAPLTEGSICPPALWSSLFVSHLFSVNLLSFCYLPDHSPLVSLSCSRGSPSRGGILAPILLLCAACSQDAAWSQAPARLRSYTWSSRTVRWESRTLPSPWGCAASVSGCSTALEVKTETDNKYSNCTVCSNSKICIVICT